MSTKLTVEKIKELLKSSFNSKKLKKNILEYYLEDCFDSDFSIQDVIETLGYKENTPINDVKKKICDDFTNLSNWNIPSNEEDSSSIENKEDVDTKQVLGDNWEYYFDDFDFLSDFYGSSNNLLIQDLASKDPEIFSKCILRDFYPIEPFNDNFRLDVISTPDDTKILGWVIVVD